MTEEEMWEWRKRKRTSDYYTSFAPIFRCEKCIEPFHAQVSLTSHKKQHSEAFGKISCYICEQRCHDEKSMAQHKQTHYRLLTCLGCGHEWDSVNAMREHGEAAHSVPVAAWQCELCRREYTCRSVMWRHYVNHWRAPCGDCGKLIGCKQMAKHVMIQHRDRADEERVRCEVCGKGYRGGAGGLQLHMRTHENNVDTAAYCVPCGVQYRTMTTYRTHLKNSPKHSAEQGLKYQCDECGKAFPGKVHLSYHIRFTHGTPHPCAACGKVFKNKRRLRAHMRVTHEGIAPVNDIVCDYCGRAYKTKKILKDHINTHTGARPYACQLCGATFGFASALYLHGRYKHKINPKRDKS